MPRQNHHTQHTLLRPPPLSELNVMASSSPFPTRYQVFQPRTLAIPLLTNFPTTTNNLSTCIRPSNLPLQVTLSLSATIPSHEKTSGSNSPIKHTTINDLDFDNRTTRIKIKRLLHKITKLSSSNTKPKMLQILQKDDEVFKTISDFNHFLMALVIAQEHEICLALFAKLPSFHLVPDGSTYSIMIRCHCERNDPDEAKRVLDTLLEHGFQPNDATITVLLSSLCNKGKVQKAFEVFELMGEMGFKVSVQSHNCLLKGLCYVGKVEKALEMLMNMKEGAQLLKPDVYSYTVVMDGLCKVGLSDEAMGLLNEAVEMGIVPNVVTFNTLLQGFSREGRPMEGVAVLELMKKKHGCVPCCVNYSTVLYGLIKWNEVPVALMVYKEMVKLGFEVDLKMMGKLVRRLCKMSRSEKGFLQDACQVFEKMKERGSVVVDNRTLEAMVLALCCGERFDEALENLNDMVRFGYSPEAITFEKVIQGLCAKGRVEEAVSSLILWLENGGVPHRKCYDILIKELHAQGRLICASSLFGAALKQGIAPNMECLECEFYEEGGTAS